MRKVNQKIVKEVKSGMMSCLLTSGKYRVSRNSFKAWTGKINLIVFLNTNKFPQPLDMINQKSKLLLKNNKNSPKL